MEPNAVVPFYHRERCEDSQRLFTAQSALRAEMARISPNARSRISPPCTAARPNRHRSLWPPPFGGVTSGAATGMLAHVTGKYHPAELDAFLATVPFFAALDETARRQLATQFEPVHVAAGEVIIAQGEMGDGLFLVVSGRLRVSVAAGGTERSLHDLGRGSTVGEIALLSDRPRSATVRTVRDSELLLLRAPAFRSLAERSPAVLAAMARLLIDRLLAVDRPQ